MTDPLRVLDDGSASPALRSLLESARRSDDPHAGQIDALSARLAPLMVPLVPIAPPAPVPIPTVVAGASHAALAVKVGAAIVAVGLAGGGAWYVHDSHAPAPVVVPIVVPSQPVPPPPAPTPTPTPAPSPPMPAPPAGHRAIDPAAESKLVTAAEAALVHGDPATALARAREHAMQFPSGAHAEERDRIAIEALVRLGKVDTAHAAADHFFTRYPHSIYRARLETLLK